MKFSDRAAAMLIFAGVFAFYIWTMSPSVSVGDSGEFIAASATLSLPHAPSYPLFSLMGKLSILLAPFANLAYRVNLVSILFGAGTASLLFILGRQLGLPLLAGLVSALTLAFSNALWEHSLTAEVFSLNAFLALLVLCAATVDAENFSVKKRLSAASFLFGLGLGNHHTLVFVVPAVALLFFFEMRSDGKSVSAALKGLAACLPQAFLFFLAGFSIYIFLPIRSFKNPPMDWSNPETLQNFIRVVTRADYGSLSLTLGEKLPRNFETALLQTLRFLKSLAVDFSLPGLALMFSGWFFWFRRNRGQAFSLLVFFLLSGTVFLILGNLPFDAQSTGILPRFYLMPALSLALALGFLVQAVQDSRLSKSAIIFLALPAFLLFNGHGHRTFSRTDFAAYDYGKNLLRTLPRGSALFMDGGDDTFYTLAYLTMAEKRRPDLELHDRGGLIYKNPYGDDFRKIPKPEKDLRRHKVEAQFLGLKPLYYSTFAKDVLPGARLIPRGILAEAVPLNLADPRPQTGPALWQTYSFRGVYESLDRPYRLRALVPLYPYLEAWQAEQAFPLLRRALGFGEDVTWLKGNILYDLAVKAYEETRDGQFEKAERLYREILILDPKSASAWSNLGVLAEKRNDFAAAEDFYRKASGADPGYADAFYNLGVLYWKQNRWGEVVKLFEKTLQLNPGHFAARKYLDQARQKLDGEPRAR